MASRSRGGRVPITGIDVAPIPIRAVLKTLHLQAKFVEQSDFFSVGSELFFECPEFLGAAKSVKAPSVSSTGM